MDQLKQELVDHLIRWHKMTDLEARVEINASKATLLAIQSKDGVVYASVSIAIPHVCKAGCGKIV